MSFLIGLAMFLAAQGYLFDFMQRNFDSVKDDNILNYIISGLGAFVASPLILIAVLVMKFGLKKKLVWDFGILRPVVGKLFGIKSEQKESKIVKKLKDKIPR